MRLVRSDLDALKVQPPDEDEAQGTAGRVRVQLPRPAPLRRGLQGGTRGGKSEVRSPKSEALARRRASRASSWCWWRETEGGGGGAEGQAGAGGSEPQDHCRCAARVSLGGDAGRAGEARQDLAGAELLLLRHRDHQPRPQGGAAAWGWRSPSRRTPATTSPCRRSPAEAKRAAGRVPPGAGVRAHREGRPQPEVRSERAQVARASRCAASSSTPWSPTASSSRRCATAWITCPRSTSATRPSRSAS